MARPSNLKSVKEKEEVKEGIIITTEVSSKVEIGQNRSSSGGKFRRSPYIDRHQYRQNFREETFGEDSSE